MRTQLTTREEVKVPAEGVLLPVRRPHLLPLLKAIAGVTVFAFTVTSVIPSGYASTNLRGMIEKKVEAGLEERLRGSIGQEPVSTTTAVNPAPVVVPAPTVGLEEPPLPAAKPEPVPRPASPANFWANRAGLEEESRISRRDLLKTGVVAATTLSAMSTTGNLSPAQNETEFPVEQTVVAQPAPQAELLPLNRNYIQIDWKDGKMGIKTTSKGDRSIRATTPPGIESRNPQTASGQATKSRLAGVQNMVSRLLKGPEEVQNWFAVRQYAESIIPKNHDNVILSLNDFRDFMDHGKDRMAVMLQAIGLAAKAQNSTVSIAVDIGGFVDNRDFSDLPAPISETVVREYIQPFVEEAHTNDVKVLPYSSDIGMMTDTPSYAREIQDALLSVFDREAVVTDWEWWASPVGVPNEWDLLSRPVKKQRALLWLNAHEDLLDRVISENEIPVTPKPTQIYSLVNREFFEILMEALKEKDPKLSLPDRLHLVIMAYDTPQGGEVKAVSDIALAVAQTAGHPVGVALNFEPEVNPQMSLYPKAREGQAGELVRQIAQKVKNNGEPLFLHIPTHRQLANLLENGRMLPAPPTVPLQKAEEAVAGFTTLAVGSPTKAPELLLRYTPKPETAAEVTQRTVVTPVTRGIGFGTIGVGSVPGALSRNLNAWFGKGVWWFLDPDTFILGPEAGLTVSSLKKAVGTLVGGQLEVVDMTLEMIPVDEKGKKVGETIFVENVMGQPDPIRNLKGTRYQAKLHVKVERPGARFGEKSGWFPIVTSIEAEVALGYPGYGRTPLTKSSPVSLSADQSNADVTVDLGEITPTISFFILKSRDQNEKITGWVGPMNSFFMAQHTDYLLSQYKKKWDDLQALLLSSKDTLREKAQKEIEKMGAHVTALQLAVDHRGDSIVPMSVEEYDGDKEAMRAKLQRLRRHGVTQLSIRVPDMEKNADDYLEKWGDQDILGLELAAAKIMFGDQSENFHQMIEIAHEVGLSVGLQLDAAELDRLTDPTRSQRAKNRIQNKNLAQQSHGLEILRLIIKANEQFGFQMDFFNLYLHSNVDLSRVRADFQVLRKDIQKTMNMLDTLLIETGAPGGVPTQWSQYAARVSAKTITPKQALEILEAKGPNLVQKARHRFQRALFIEGESVDKILEILDQRFTFLADATARDRDDLLKQLVERIRISSVTALRAVDVPEERIPEVLRRAASVTEEQLSKAVKNKEDWAAFLLMAQAWELDQAQNILLARYQNPLDKAYLSLYNIRPTRLLTVGDTHPFVSLKTLPIQKVQADGTAAIRVQVRNNGNLPAQYVTTLHLMGEDEAGRPAWPLEDPRVERFTREVILMPGEAQEIEFIVSGSAVRDVARVNYRVLARDVNTLLHKPGQNLGLALDEEAFARAEGSLLVIDPPTQPVTVGMQFSEAARKFESAEELRRQRTKERPEDPVYARGYAQRYIEYMSAFASDYELSIDETGTYPKPLFTKRAVTFAEHKEDYRQQQAAKQNPVSLIPKQSELGTARGLRKALEYGAALGLIATAVAAWRHVTSTARRSYQEARHTAALRANARHDRQPVGSFGEIIDMTNEWSHFVVGMGAKWFQRMAHLHPEQGKVSRAMEAHGRVTVGLRQDLQEEGLPGPSHPQSRLERLQKLAPKIVFNAVLVIVAVVLLNILPLIGVTVLAGSISVVIAWAAIGNILLIGAVTLLGVAAITWLLTRASIGPLLQREIARVVYFLPDIGYNPRATRVFLVVGPLIFLAVAAGLLYGVGGWVGVTVTATLLKNIGILSALWVALWMVGAWRDNPFGVNGFVWRMFGAFAIGVVGFSALFLVVGLPTLWFWVAAGAIYFGTLAATRLFTSQESPLSAYTDWAHSRQFLVRWAITGLVLYTGYMIAAALFAVMGPFFAMAVPVFLGTTAVGTLVGLTAWQVAFSSVMFIAGSGLLFYLLGSRYQLMQNSSRVIRWGVTGLVSVGLGVFGIPALLALLSGWIGIPAVWATYLMAIGMLGYSIGQWGKAVEFLLNKPANQGWDIAVLRALFRGGVLGIGAAIALPIGLAYVLHLSAGTLALVAFVSGVVLPATVLLIALWDYTVPLRYRLQEEFEREQLLRYQYVGAFQWLLDSGAVLSDSFGPLLDREAIRETATLNQVQAQFNDLAAHLPNGRTLSDAERERLLNAYQIRRAPDQLPLADYDAALLRQAWEDAHQTTYGDFRTRHGLTEEIPPYPQGPSAPTPAQQMVGLNPGEGLTPEQQRVLNMYYWRYLAEREADQEIRRLSRQQLGREIGLNQDPENGGLPLVAQEMLVAHYFNRYQIQKKDTILNQDEGTTLRSFGGFVWTSDLSHLMVRMREDDTISVIMPALILSLEYAMDGPSIFGLQQMRNAFSNYGLPGGVVVTLTMFAQVLLVNIAVPLGFIASMVNRWSRAKVQGGNVLHTLRASADAGMEGYQKAFWYVILVLGRWLQGLLFTLMEVYLGRWVGRRSIEEYQATRVFEGIGDGSFGNRIRTLLSEDSLQSLVVAHYTGLIGEDNSLFDMGHFSFPRELLQVPWMFRKDAPGVTDDEAFAARSNNQQVAGGIEWRTEGGIGGGPVRVPFRYEIVDVLDLNAAGSEEKKVIERLANGLVRIRQAGQSLRYLPPVSGAEVTVIQTVLAEQKGDWEKAIKTIESSDSPAIARKIERISGGKYLYIVREPDGKTEVFVNGKNQGETLVKNRQRRVSSEPGKFHVAAPRGKTKGENAGAGLMYLLGMVETRIELYEQGGKIGVRLPFVSTEQQLYPELEGARHEIHNHQDRLQGEFPREGQQAAYQILRDNDYRVRRQTGRTAVSDIVGGEAGHHQVRDASGQRFQWFMNFFRTLLSWERGHPNPWRQNRPGANRSGPPWLNWIWSSVWVVARLAAAGALLWVAFQGIPVFGATVGIVKAVVLSVVILSANVNWWWGLKITLGLYALFSAWPWGLVLAIAFPTFAAHLWGIIYPIGFIGNVQKNRLQGLRGHYQDHMVQSALDRLERRLSSSGLAAVESGQSAYNEQVRRGSQFIRGNNNLQRIAYLYHRVIGPEEVQPSLASMFGFNLFMHVEPRLAEAIAQIPGVERPGAMLPTRLWARNALEQAVVRELANQTPEQRRDVFEALKWRVVGELLAVGNEAIATQYHRSRNRNVIRVGDVNSQFGVEGQERLTRMMATQQRVRIGNEQVVLNGAYPFQGDRSWTRHSPAALYGGIAASSMMYSRTSSGLLAQLTEGAQRGGFLVERMAIVESTEIVDGKKIPNRVLYIESDYLVKDHGNLETNPDLASPDRGRGLLIMAHEGGALSDDLFEHGMQLLETVEYQAQINQVNPSSTVEKTAEAFLKEHLEGLQGIVVLGYVWNAKENKFENKVKGSSMKAEEALAKMTEAESAQEVHRIDPLEAALTQRRDGQSIRDFYLENTHLQPDLEVLENYQQEVSRQLPISTNVSAQQVDSYQVAREARESRPDSIVRMSTIENQINWGAIGFSGGDLQSALVELQESIRRTGTVSLTPRRGPIAWVLDLFNFRTQPYSREAILLSLIYGVTEQQLIRRNGRIVGLRWTNLDSHFDASEWQFAVGPYLWPGSTMGRIGLWMRRGKMHMAPPIPLVEAIRLLEMPPWLAVASGFNRLPTDAFSLPQLLTEDGRHGSLNRLTPTLNPTMNAWNMHKAAFMMYQLYLRKGDKSTQRALQYFVGMAIDQVLGNDQQSGHLFDHPIFGTLSQQAREDTQRVFRNSFGLQALVRDEMETAGARGAGTFSYGLTGYTGSWLAGVRVGPLPPGHVAAYRAYRQYQALDRRWGGLFNAVTRQAQREAQYNLDQATISGDASIPTIYSGHLVDPWYVLSEAGALIEQERRQLHPDTPVGVGRADAIGAVVGLARQRLIQPVVAPVVGLEETATTLPSETVSGARINPGTTLPSGQTSTGLEERVFEADKVRPLEISAAASERQGERVAQADKYALVALIHVQPEFAGLEEVQLGTPQAWAGSSAGQVIPVSVSGEGRSSSGRAVVLDPAQVHIRQIMNPDVTGEAWDWSSIRTRPKAEQPGKLLADLVSNPQQWGVVEVPAGARLGLAMHSFQTNFWEPQGFLVTQGRLVALPGVTWSHEPEVFVLDAGQLGLRRLSLADGIPQAQEIQEAVVGPVLIRNGQDVSEEIEQYPKGSPDPNAVTWDPRTTAAAFSALARTAHGRLIFLSLVGEPQTGLRQATVGDVAQAILAVGTVEDPVVEGMLLGGSMDVQQWVAGDGEKPGVLGRHNNAPHDAERNLNAAILVYYAAGLEQVTTAGTELRSPVTETGDIPAQSTRLDPPANLSETRVAVISARAAEGTGLEELAGQPKRVGEGWLWVLPPQATAETLSEGVMPFMGMSNVVFQEYGGLEEFVGFNAMVKGLASVQAPRVLTGTTLLEILRQIFANLASVAPEAISDDQLAGMEEALGLGVQL